MGFPTCVATRPPATRTGSMQHSRTGALRVESLLVVGASTGQASQQTVDYGSHLHQVGDRPEPAGPVRRGDGAVFQIGGMFSGAEISPIGWNENGIGVRWGEQKIRATVLPLLTKNSNNLSFQRMASAEDRYLLWQGMVVGSLSSDRSTELITTNSWHGWQRASRTGGCFGLSGAT